MDTAANHTTEQAFDTDILTQAARVDAKMNELAMLHPKFNTIDIKIMSAMIALGDMLGATFAAGAKDLESIEHTEEVRRVLEQIDDAARQNFINVITAVGLLMMQRAGATAEEFTAMGDDLIEFVRAETGQRTH